MNNRDIIPLAEIRAARERIADAIVRTPLVRLVVDDGPAEIFLKLENLQNTGAFKLRGALNAMRVAGGERLAKGVWTVSSGNMAQGVAWSARILGVDCTVIVPDTAPDSKLAAIRRQGAQIVQLPYAEVIHIASTHRHEGMEGLFIHPVGDPAVMAGNGTIGLEILEDLPNVDAVVMPFGGGGLLCGAASAVRALRPEARLYASEVESAAPLAASLRAGRPVEIEATPSFIDGIGIPLLFPEMWPLASRLVDGSLISTVAEVIAAVRLLVERAHVVAEGAAATSVAAALAGKAGAGKVVCVVSGGNIDPGVLARILRGEAP